MAKTAFIGLGTMGFPMAGHLAAQGHEVCVYNRSTAKAETWVSQHAGKFALTPAEAAKDADFVFICVGNDDDLRSVTTAETGVLNSMKSGSVLIDHTTASAEVARELYHAAVEKGIGFLDAPVSGGQAGAEQGVLSVMIGGDDAVYAKAEPIIASFARSQKLMGGSGSGQLAKMVNQICIAGLVQGLAEAVHFIKKSGLDGEKVFDVIQHGAAGSWQMANRHKTMLNDEFDFGFAVDWMRKDLSIALNEARKNGAQLPVTALVDQFYAEVQQKGGGRWDTSSLVKRFNS
ncbi:NAD(P)-dependent oxidoreductase [Nitrincola schmidtii]|uniref:NAD(P)-dependent oxidoreductase n=1 Tax=Nitrincola schmidtii TaxID=1730894 RepID=UPI00124C6C01|nr:NAD(P)-dependent oxidoreductase [Nitrincola schmidtii]